MQDNPEKKEIGISKYLLGKKPRCRVNWKKLYSISGIREWIVESPEHPQSVLCKFCQVKLRAHTHDLKKHARSKKHRRYIGPNCRQIYDRAKCSDSIGLASVEFEDGISQLESRSLIGLEKSELNFALQSGYEKRANIQNSVFPICFGFIGAGNITQAFLSGFLANGILETSNVVVSAPSNRNLDKLKPLGIRTTHDNNIVVQECDVIVLAVKFQHVAEAIANIEPVAKPCSPLFLSTVSGLSTYRLEGMLAAHSVRNPRIVRLVPNNSCMVLQGSCVYSLGSHTSDAERIMLRNLLGSVGLCLEVPEMLLDAVSTLSSCGSAYIYAMIDALANGGVKMGLSREMALILAAQTVKGAATMTLETGKHPGRLKDEVCSSSKVVAARLEMLDMNRMRNVFESAFEMATKSIDNSP